MGGLCSLLVRQTIEYFIHDGLELLGLKCSDRISSLQTSLGEIESCSDVIKVSDFDTLQDGPSRI